MCSDREDDVGMDISWLEEKGISVKDGIGYTGNEDKYVSALQRYFKNYGSNKNAVEELLAAGDTEGYAIKVHSLKSNSKMIGAAKLAEAFEELELAAKAGDAAFINEKTGTALQLYTDIIEIIRPIGEMQSISVAGEIGADEARKTVEQLLAALDDFDDELSASLVRKLRGYPFRITQKEMLNQAADAIGDFMYDDAAEIIREIASSIE